MKSLFFFIYFLIKPSEEYNVAEDFENLLKLRAIFCQKSFCPFDMLFAVLHFGKWFSKTRFRAGKFPSFLRFLIPIYLTQTFDIEFVFGDCFNIFATNTSTSWIKIATDQCWRWLDQGSTVQSRWESRTGPGPRKISKLGPNRTGQN